MKDIDVTILILEFQQGIGENIQSLEENFINTSREHGAISSRKIPLFLADKFPKIILKHFCNYQ